MSDNVQPPPNSVAIIGMSGRFPGAPDIPTLWRNLVEGRCATTDFCEDELEFSQAALDVERSPAYVRARPILEDVDQFDASFFGILPKQAELMDPQHRVFLEGAWEALESAGYDPEAFPGLVGLYAGVSLNTYLLHNLVGHRDGARVAVSYPVGVPDILFGNDKDFLTTRVAHKLNLRGPCVTVQSACSTSSVAVCHAYYSLLTYQCDMAMAGGVSITLPQKRDYLYQPDGMVSRDGRCRSFDAGADGTVFGSGMGIVVLKRLPDAIADGDFIHAVIRGVAMNNDGADRIGYAAPGVNGQAEVIAMAQAEANVDPETISYVEAHGTGTPLGDPIEIAALNQAFRKSTQAKGFCGIGSVKPNVGHLDVAAGVTGLIKTVLQLQHETIPPLIHFTASNPKIDFESSPFYPVTKLTEWKRSETPRRAGVSAFGVGGTNAHVVLEEAPEPEPAGPSRSELLLVLSARTRTALDAMSANLAIYLKGQQGMSLPDVAYTLHKGRRAFAHRRVLVASTASEAVSLLMAPDSQGVYSSEAPKRVPGLVFLFPGQGAQYVDMGRDLYGKEPAFAVEVDRCVNGLEEHLGTDIRSVLFPEEDARDFAQQQIGQTSVTQPAMFVIEYALAKLWMSWGLQPSVVIGHSVGEYVCAVLAGTLELDDALRLLSVRARLMQALPSGSMMVVRMPAEQVESILPSGTSIAAFNSPKLCTVSGQTPALEALQKILEDRNVEALFLPAAHAFHSAMMDPILDELSVAAATIALKPSSIPWISTCTGRLMTPEDTEDGDYWCRQVRNPVRFFEALNTLFEDTNCVLLEVGPGQTLSQIASQHPARPSAVPVLGSLPANRDTGQELRSMLTALGRLWAAGVEPDWESFHAGELPRRVPLPTYPFERKRFWIDPPGGEGSLRPSVAVSGAGEERPGDGAEARPNAEFRQAVELPNTTTGLNMSKISNEVPAGQRREELLRQLRNAFQELSGVEIVDDTASFMELGFDSLFLTQVSQALQARFGVEVTFRRLLDDLSTVSALANYLDQKLPTETPEDVPKTPSSGGQEIPVPQASQRHDAASSGIEQLIANQIQLMQALLDQQSTKGSPGPAPAVRAGGELLPVKWPGTMPPAGLVKKQDTREEFKRFGPYKPIETGEKGELTPRQRKALDGLIERYVRRTRGSKSYTAEHRPYFADPRAVSGFQTRWKEMVYPIVAGRSKGSKIWDIDGNEYVDVTMGFGAYLFGHSPDWLLKALEDQMHTGIEVGPQSPLAGEVARRVCEFTGMERAAFCNTGSEAVMAAIRVARTVSGRNRVVYFTGDYHGMFEEALARGAWINGEYGARPIAPGIPPSLVENMLVLEYGAAESIDIIRKHADEIAAVIVEPVQSRNPTLQPKSFLLELRQLTARSGVALVFDEVVTGFRCHPGGAQAHFGVHADLATYGKVVGGGLPIGILAGIRKYMDVLDGGMWSYGDDSFPEVGVTFFAGTFVRHPLAIAAAHAVLGRLKKEGPALQLRLAERVSLVSNMLNSHFEAAEVPIRFNSFSAVAAIEHSNELGFGSLLWYYLREKGIHVWEGRPCVFTVAHTDADLDHFVRAFKESVSEMQEDGFLPESPAAKDPGASIATVKTGIPTVDRAPLTGAQREIFLSTRMGDEANCAYNESITIRFEGAVDIKALQDGLRHLFERHPALRSTVSPDGENQLFHPPSATQIPMHDWRGGDAASGIAQWLDLVRAETATPFDLFNGPLVRMHLARLSDTDLRLAFSAHHLVCDGWSMGMLVAELATLYNALKADRIPMLAPPMSFADYARSEPALKAGAAYAVAEQFWTAQFPDGAPTLELPTDRTRPVLKSFKGAMASRVIDTDRFMRLKKATPALGGTLFATLLATFAALLHRLSNQQDLVIGVPAAGQTMIGCDELVGHCLNFLPLHLKFAEDTSFSEFAGSVKSAILDGYEHQCVTYGALLQKLDLPRDTSRLPLVSVMFNIDKSGFDFLKFDDLDFEISTNAKQFVNFDLFFNLVQSESSLEVECEYNTDLFDESTILQWLNAFEVLIEEVIVAGGTKLRDLPLVDQTGHEKLLKAWNETACEYPRNITIHSLFEKQAGRHPNKVAVTCNDKSLTYAELNDAANELAARLSLLGVTAEGLVGLYADRSVDMVVGLIGILKSGGAYVPLDPMFPAERLRHMIEDTHLQVIVTQRSKAGELPAHDGTFVFIDDRFPDSGDFQAGRSTGADLAYVIFTSGSTGRPKGVQVEHRAVVNFLNSMRREPGLSLEDILLAVTTLSFDIAALELFLPLTTGATVAIAEEEITIDGNLLQRELGRTGATVMQATPTTWRLLLEAGWEGNPGLKVLIGGEAVPRDLVNQLAPRCGSVWNMYGPTETTIWSATTQLMDGDGPVSIGRPIDNTQIYVVSSSLQLQPVGVPGELLIGGDGVSRGYHGNAELTSDRFIPDPFSSQTGARVYRTGDLAKWRPDGSLECFGRLDNQVKIRGFRIELGDVEAAVATHPGVKQNVAVVGEGPSGQRRLVAYFVPAMSPAPPTAELRGHVNRYLPDYMVPSLFVPLAEFPLTPNGKVDRRALSVRDDSTTIAVDTPVIAPRTSEEEVLTDIWKQVLQQERVSIDDDIFELGGDSILIFQVTSRANQQGLPLTPAQVFEHRSIEKLAKIVTADQGSLPQAATPVSVISRIDRDMFRRN